MKSLPFKEMQKIIVIKTLNVFGVVSLLVQF